MFCLMVDTTFLKGSSCMMGLVARELKSERTSQHTLSQWHSLLAEKSHTHKREWGKHVTLITKFQGGSE
jgi:hypothetical protein